MPYVKAIIYGENLELYNYEKDINPTGGKKLGNKSRDNSSSLVTSGEPTIKKSSRRRDNSRRAGLSFRRLVLANMAFDVPPILATFTYAENQTDLAVGYKDWNAFVRGVRYHIGKSWKYIVVPEFQKRGSLHFHALLWGIPEDRRKQERRTRFFARCWGKGFVDLIATDGNERIAGYIAKYMVKGYNDERLFAKKAYRCSRNVVRPVCEKNLGGMHYVSEVYGIGGDNPPCEDKEFGTQWMGKGRFRLYKIKQKTK